jgi:hypothetical protein
MKINRQRIVDIVASLVFMGSMWQLEITVLNRLNGDFPFGYFFSIIRGVDNWAAADFWMLLMIVAFVVVALNGDKPKGKKRCANYKPSL